MDCRGNRNGSSCEIPALHLRTGPILKQLFTLIDFNEGCDWRIDSGGDTELDGYRDLIKDQYFIKG